MITLANEFVALTVNPKFGARVTALTDLATGRQWLVPGDCVRGDAYLGDKARGWDECFPTVGVCDHPAWGSLRDHGVLWGRPCAVTHGATTCTATFADPRFVFARSLTLHGSTILSDYHVTNRSPTPLPYLWSQHALLATTPDDRITLHGISGPTASGQPVDWPHLSLPGHPARDLSRIGTPDDGFALKLYGRVPDTACAEVTGPTGGIRFDWSGADIPAFGLWLDYGGWPPGTPVHQIALEPTTAPADDLAQSEAMGSARLLGPGASHRCSVRITLTRPKRPQ